MISVQITREEDGQVTTLRGDGAVCVSIPHDSLPPVADMRDPVAVLSKLADMPVVSLRISSGAQMAVALAAVVSAARSIDPKIVETGIAMGLLLNSTNPMWRETHAPPKKGGSDG